MAIKPRRIVFLILGIGIWAAAVKLYLDAKSEERREEEARTQRNEPTPPKFGPGLGNFETYFAEQHPLSNREELMRRLALRPRQLEPTTNPAMAPGVTEDSYDLSRQSYCIYVPENYSAQVPHGVIYYIGYKDTTSMPPRWKETLDERHLIFISIRNCVRPEWQHAAVALDAVHNLKKQYTIDDKRIYLFEFPNNPGLVGLQMGLGLPDVFSGFVHINRLEHYRNVTIAGQGRYFPAQVGMPPPDLLTVSMKKPHAFVLQNNFFVRPNTIDRRSHFQNALRRDGFERVLFIDIADPEHLHYPNFHGPWLAETLEFLERPQ